MDDAAADVRKRLFIPRFSSLLQPDARRLLDGRGARVALYVVFRILALVSAATDAVYIGALVVYCEPIL